MPELLSLPRPRRRFSPSKIFLIINAAVIIAIFMIGFRPGAFQRPITDKDLAFYNDQYLIFTARVCEEADVSVSNRRLTVCTGQQRDSADNVEGEKDNGKRNDNLNQSRTLVTTKLYPIYDYGDFVKISGRLQTPPKFEGFDYESYLARYDIYSVMYYPKIERVVRGGASSEKASFEKASSEKMSLERVSDVLTWPQTIYGALIKFKQSLAFIINSSLPEPEAGLANAILLGYRRTVERADLDIFSRVGLSHMIAISGSHITILSAMIVNFFLALGVRRRRAFFIVFAFLFLYPFITGLSASAVRSAIMGGLAFLAVYYGRASSLINALIFAAALMLIFNPRLLRVDIGFQLSFLALIGIIYLYPLGEQATRRFLNKRKWSRGFKKFLKTFLDTINLTLVSQIITLPVLLINFQQLSLIAPLANVLVLWTFPLLLAALIIALAATALIPVAGVLWFLPAYLLLKFIFIVAGLLAAPSRAAVSINWFNWGWGILYYLVLFLAVRFLRRILIKAERHS